MKLRATLHQTLEAQQNKLIQTFLHILCDMKFALGEGAYDTAIISNFQLKIHMESIV